MKAPDKIFLTNGDREHLINFDTDAANGLVMWCEDKITDHDIEYIRKDSLWKPTPEQLEALDCAVIDYEEDYCNIARKRVEETIVEEKNETI